MNVPAAAPPPPRKRRRALLIVTVIFALVAIGALLLYFLVLSRRETTDDAYVSGNLVTISAQLPGTVVSVMADDTQLVKSGQVLVRLDPTDGEVALNQASAQLAQAVRQIRQQTATADQLDAAVKAAALQLQMAQADLARRVPLVRARAIAPEELTHAQTQLEVARQSLSGAQRQAAAAHALIGATGLAQQPAILQARAAYVQAWIGVQRTTILAPISGYIAQRSVQIGQRIQPGQSLMTVVPLENLWIDANFKESQLRHLRMGQTAKVTTDVYGGEATFHGQVAGVAPGTGSAFSLLPAQNASGNWIKVTQRVPVRIALEPEELRQHPLRIGLSADINVDTQDRSGAMLASTPNVKPVADTDIYATLYRQAGQAADAIVADAQSAR